MRDINQVEWRKLIANDQKAVIIDARRPDEWVDGVIENALLMNVLELEHFEKEVSQLEKEKNYYVYCRSGKRSVRACQILEDNEIKNTFNLLGGWLAWDGTKVIPVQQ